MKLDGPGLTQPGHAHTIIDRLTPDAGLEERLSLGEPWKCRLGRVNGGSLGRKHES
jgi:hypothetical protein